MRDGLRRRVLQRVVDEQAIGHPCLRAGDGDTVAIADGEFLIGQRAFKPRIERVACECVDL